MLPDSKDLAVAVPLDDLQSETAARRLESKPAGRGSWPLLALIATAAGVNLGAVLARYPASPFRFDESEWPPQALGILRHGVPRVDFADTRETFPFLAGHALPYPAIYGMWHPPLYEYSLAVVAALFGTGSVPLRLTGLAWFAISALLIWRITGRVGGPGLPRLARGLPIAVALLCPLVSQGIFLLDIDNTVLTTALLLMMDRFLKDPNSASPARLLSLGALLALALACKLTTPYILLVSLLVYQACNRRWRLAMLQPVVIGATGTGLFAAAYLLYSSLLHYPASYMFDITFVKAPGHFWTRPAIDELHTLHWYLVWISPSVSALLLAGSAARLLRFRKLGRAEPVDLLLIFAWLNWIAYALWIGIWGKYMMPGVVAGLIVAGSELARAAGSIRITRPRLLAGLTLTVVLLALALPPLETRWHAIDYHHLGIVHTLLTSPEYLYPAAAIAGLTTFMATAGCLLRSPSGLVSAGLACALFAAVSLPVETIKLAISPDDRAPYRVHAGERGFDEMAAYLRATVKPGELTIAPKDMGLYMSTPYVPSDKELLAGDPPTDLVAAALDPACRYLVEDVDYPEGPLPLQLAAQDHFQLTKRIGSWALYEKPHG